MLSVVSKQCLVEGLGRLEVCVGMGIMVEERDRNSARQDWGSVPLRRVGEIGRRHTPPNAVVCVSSAVLSNTGCGPARTPLVLSD